MTPFFQIEARWAPIFSNQNTLGAFFANIFRYFAQIFRDFAKVFTDFAQISTDFARIFTKSELLGMRFNPRLLHRCFRSVCIELLALCTKLQSETHATARGTSWPVKSKAIAFKSLPKIARMH